jgi:hypothetical protein
MLIFTIQANNDDLQDLDILQQNQSKNKNRTKNKNKHGKESGSTPNE